jgi:hypothetical protein
MVEKAMGVSRAGTKVRENHPARSPMAKVVTLVVGAIHGSVVSSPLGVVGISQARAKETKARVHQAMVIARAIHQGNQVPKANRTILQRVAKMEKERTARTREKARVPGARVLMVRANAVKCPGLQLGNSCQMLRPLAKKRIPG